MSQNKCLKNPENSKDECLYIRCTIRDVLAFRLTCFKQKLNHNLYLVRRFS